MPTDSNRKWHAHRITATSPQLNTDYHNLICLSSFIIWSGLTRSLRLHLRCIIPPCALHYDPIRWLSENDSNVHLTGSKPVMLPITPSLNCSLVNVLMRWQFAQTKSHFNISASIVSRLYILFEASDKRNFFFPYT